MCVYLQYGYIYMWVHGFYDGKFQSLNLPARLDSQKAKDPLDPPSLMKKWGLKCEEHMTKYNSFDNIHQNPKHIWLKQQSILINPI